LTPEELVIEHLGLVEILADVAARRLPRWLDRDDLVQTGRIGLLQAAERYEPERGTFRTFASMRILGAIYDAFRRKNYSYELHEELPRRDGGGQGDPSASERFNPHPSCDANAERDVQRRQVRRHLERATEDLTEDERHAVIGHALHDLGYRAIGSSRDRSLSWAWREAQRGHAKMRVSLNRVGIRGVL
jgi:RNA polymerase sigma factor (sigma-70 family)